MERERQAKEGEEGHRGGERPMGTTADGGKGSRGRAANGNHPKGAARCRPQHTKGVIPTPPLPSRILRDNGPGVITGYSRKFLESGIRSFQYACPTAQCGSGHDCFSCISFLSDLCIKL